MMKCVLIHSNKKYLWGYAGLREVSKTDTDPGLSFDLVRGHLQVK